MKLFVVTLAAALAAGATFAQAPAASHAHSQPHGGAAAANDFTTGEVRRVDMDAQKVTLRHGPIPNLGMGDMTMVFRVADSKMLDGLKPGDKVRFKADKVGGQFMVTEVASMP